MSMRKWVAGIVVVLAAWMGGYAFLTRDPDTTAYRELCVQSAQSALDGLGTARLSADGDLLGTYQTAMMDDAQGLIGGARSAMAAQAPPDDPSVRRRDTLVPLLDEAEKVYEDLVRARSGGDDRAARDAAGRMEPLEEQLRDFIDGNR